MKASLTLLLTVLASVGTVRAQTHDGSSGTTLMAWQHYYDSAKAHPYVMPDSDRARFRAEDSVHILQYRESLAFNEKEVAIAKALGDTAEIHRRERFLPLLREHIANAEAGFQRHYGEAWRAPETR